MTPTDLVHGRIRFIDNLPHKMNVPEWQSYIGPYPTKDYFKPEVLSVEGRKKVG